MFLSWDEEDQDKALAWQDHEALRCQRCGTFPEEWLDPEDKTPVEPPPYKAIGIRCLGCVTLDLEHDEAGKNQKGLYVHLVPNHGSGQ